MQDSWPLLGGRWLPLLWLLLAPVAAQQTPPQRRLDDLLKAFTAQQDRLYQGEQAPTAEQERELLRRQADELAAFVAHEAAGDDRWHGRLLLADLRRSTRDRDGAIAALTGIDAAAASGKLLLAAATMAAEMGDRPLRDRLVEQALARPATLAERLAMARELMTELREVERGERIFTAALAAAADDEARAEIRFARATAIRAREDLPENSYYVELERLAADLPATRYGSIARDRAAASQFKLGGAAIPFRARTIGGETVALAELQGKAVLLAFWSLADHGAGATIAAIEQLRSQHGQDLFVLGIALESDCAAFAKALAPLGATFPQVCDGGGADAELALRYHVETTPTLIVLDRQGKIAGLNLHVDTVDAQQELAEALARALAPASPK